LEGSLDVGSIPTTSTILDHEMVNALGLLGFLKQLASEQMSLGSYLVHLLQNHF